MENQFEILRVTRKNVLKEIDDLSIQALFEIPNSYNNHILWYTIHIIVSQQLLIYGNSQTPLRINREMIAGFRNGSIPSPEIRLEWVEFAKTHLLSTVDQLQKDYQNNIFGPFKQTSLNYGLVLNSVEDAIRFNNIHEAMHFGQIKMLKKVVNM